MERDSVRKWNRECWPGETALDREEVCCNVVANFKRDME